MILTTILIFACGTGSPQPSPASSPQGESASATNTSLPPTAAPIPTDTSIPTETLAPATEAPVSSGVSYANDIVPILQASCYNCHGGQFTREGLNLTTYEGIMAGSFNGPVIMPGIAGDSFLVEQIVTGEMPNRGPKLTDEQIQLISEWINQGALNN
jgi:hypothetical protein